MDSGCLVEKSICLPLSQSIKVSLQIIHVYTLFLQYQVLAQGIWTRIFGKAYQDESPGIETEQTKWFDVRIFIILPS